MSKKLSRPGSSDVVERLQQAAKAADGAGNSMQAERMAKAAENLQRFMQMDDDTLRLTKAEFFRHARKSRHPA